MPTTFEGEQSALDAEMKNRSSVSSPSLFVEMTYFTITSIQYLYCAYSAFVVRCTKIKDFGFAEQAHQ
jgi:hypothetical protein